MMVSGLNREASTIRNLNCPSFQREAAPERSGAMVPWNRSPGYGPEWHNRQSPTCRFVTIFRPRAASPGAPVSDWAIASPVTV
jgi:hypothetical protein